MLFPPSCGHRGCRKVAERIDAEHVDEGLSRREVGTKVGEHLTQRSLGVLGAVDGAKPSLPIVETVIPRAELIGRICQWIGTMSDPPKLSPAHPSKLTSCLAAALTSANRVASVAWRSTSIGAASSRRVLVPKSQARAVFSSKLSTIMRTTL